VKKFLSPRNDMRHRYIDCAKWSIKT